MGPDVTTTYERIEQLPSEIKLIYTEFDKGIRPESDLHKYLELCCNVVERKSSLTLPESLELHHAQRILVAIVDCHKLLVDAKERSAFKGLIAQIEATPLAPKTPGGSHGLNAVFELEFLQYLRHRNVKARLGEPDIVVSTPFGEYYVACKSINSLNNIEANLEKATSQIAKRGVGIVALNFEPHVYYDGAMTVSDPVEVMAALDRNASDVYKNYEPLFNRKLSAGCFDGITIQVCCVANVVGDLTDLNTMIHNVYYLRSNIQPKDAVVRFRYFWSAMKGVYSYYR
ncbi:hypothetical protein [Pseudomonas protegens]|uniref:hypothetical protein n=1 Tax=Pseudomonas protegens TaxID=380021 RepID=UPI00101204C6|nr:hypothetical protein [Pseudomonas protegens]